MVHRKMLEHVRGELIRKMEERHGTLSRTAVRMKDGSDRMADLVDRAAAEHDRTVELSSRVGYRPANIEVDPYAC